MHLRAGKKNRNEVFLQEPIGADREGNEITLVGVAKPPRQGGGSRGRDRV